MNINFKTHFPWPGKDGKPEKTNFEQLIKNGFAPDHATTAHPGDVHGEKLHTIRRINGRPRFREGMKLVLTTGPRFKSKPFITTNCVSTQLLKLGLQYLPQGHGFLLTADVDGMAMGQGMLRSLARNDGFDGALAFTRWFLLDVLAHGPGEYQIVHWTDLRY